MLIKINNRKVVDTTKVPVIVMFEPHEIQMIKEWDAQDILFSHPKEWDDEKSSEWLAKRQSELVAVNRNRIRNMESERLQAQENGEPVCMHGVVFAEGSPNCPECAKIADAFGVDTKIFRSPMEIEKLKEKT